MSIGIVMILENIIVFAVTKFYLIQNTNLILEQDGPVFSNLQPKK